MRSLVQDGNQFASRLGITAGVYADTEDYLTGVAEDVPDALAGDPHLSDAVRRRILSGVETVP